MKLEQCLREISDEGLETSSEMPIRVIPYLLAAPREVPCPIRLGRFIEGSNVFFREVPPIFAGNHELYVV